MKILIADDHPLVRDALSRTVQGLAPGIETCEAADFESVRQLALGRDIDLAIVDLNMPGGSGVQGMATLRREFATLMLVVTSAQDDAATIRQVLACGVSGFIPKTDSCEVVNQALRLVLAGGVYVPPRVLAYDPVATMRGEGMPAAPLTPRQLDVLDRLLRGCSNKVIARELTLSEGTVKIHVAAILQALDANNRTEAVVRAHEIGLRIRCAAATPSGSVWAAGAATHLCT